MLPREFKGIKVRMLEKKDIDEPEKWLDFIKNLVEENVRIERDESPSMDEERIYLKALWEKQSKGTGLSIIAEQGGSKAGGCDITSQSWKRSHVAVVGIAIGKNFRGIGLGKFMLETAMREALKKLKHRPEMFRLSCLSGNTEAISLYGKLGFVETARIPEQVLHRGKYEDELVFIRKEDSEKSKPPSE